MYVVRVEFRNANYEQYKQLNNRLAIYGYFDAIPATDGKLYRLPAGEYYSEKHESADEVLAQLKSIAGAINEDYLILVTDANTISWNGLDPITD